MHRRDRRGTKIKNAIQFDGNVTAEAMESTRGGRPCLPLWFGQSHWREVIVRFGDSLADTDLGHPLGSQARLSRHTVIIQTALKVKKVHNKLTFSKSANVLTKSLSLIMYTGNVVMHTQ